ncbi:MAG: ATP-dependent dethiobiotin synthetase BioD [Rhodospirillales bacterium]|nr:ATP-dependent dethiobiotin synthetase BioD [Rhodospirillales bacterium]
MSTIIVTGTDTGIGKTVVAAMLTLALEGVYWKPVQSGTVDGTDAATVATLTGLGPERFILERYQLREPLSPHLAAEIDGIEIDPHTLELPARTEGRRLLIVEAAGGLMVPLTRRVLYIDVMQRWGVPVVLCAPTRLGCINHALLSLEALRTRNIPLLGVVFIGDEAADSERTICAFTSARRLGRLPRLKSLTPETLQAAFDAGFLREDFPTR